MSRGGRRHSGRPTDFRLSNERVDVGARVTQKYAQQHAEGVDLGND
jgi:hypothetical protein